MASVPDQKIKEKKKRVASSSKKYDHSRPPPEVHEYARQDSNGGKVIDINLKRLENYMWTRPTLALTALFFGVSGDTIENIIKKHYALSFSEFREQRLQHTKNTLIQHCLSMALEGERDFRALKFALQNLAGWTDNMQMQMQPVQTIQLRYSLDEPPQIKDVTPPSDSKPAGE